jgi:hypothetical protein
MSGGTLFERMLALSKAGLMPKAAARAPMTHYWRVRTTLPDRYRQPCRVTARGAMNSCQIEFADGTRHIVSRWAVRKLTA